MAERNRGPVASPSIESTIQHGLIFYWITNRTGEYLIERGRLVAERMSNERKG